MDRVTSGRAWRAMALLGVALAAGSCAGASRLGGGRAAAPASEASRAGRIQVTAEICDCVTGGESCHPWSGAHLSLYVDDMFRRLFADSFADDQGRAVFDNVPPGKYVLTGARGAQKYLKEEKLTVGPGSDAYQTLTLHCGEGIIWN